MTHLRYALSRTAMIATAATLIAVLETAAVAATWTGPAGGDWFTGDNWSTGSVPGAGDVAELTAGSSQTVTGTQTLLPQIVGSTNGMSFSGGGTYQITNATNSFVGSVNFDGGTFDYNGSGARDAIFGDTANDITLQGGVTFGISSGGDWNPATGRTVTIGPGGATMRNTHAKGFYVDDPDQLQGTGLLTGHNTSYGMTISLTQGQPNFAGGFNLTNTSRQSNLNATVADALGTGAITVDRAWTVNYTWDAQKAVGGLTSGITVNNGGNINLNGTVADSSTLRERFTINAGSAIGGGAAQLGYVQRVGGFSATPVGPEAVLAEDAIVLHYGANTSSIANLGTGTDLYFGLGQSFNNAGTTISVGASTPWKGISTVDGAGWFSENNIVLQKGTVSIDDGGGAVSEIFLQGLGIRYNTGNGPRALQIGNGVDSPTFSAIGSPVEARIKGHVQLASSAPDYAGGLSKFIVGTGDLLTVSAANGLDGLPVEILNGGQIRATHAMALDGNVTVLAGGRLNAGLPMNGSGSLTIQPDAIINLTAADGLTGSQGANNVQAGAIVQFAINDPQALGQTASGAVLEYGGNTYNKYTLGGLDGTGQILTRNPEAYNGQQGWIADSATGGISGTLTITAPSTGSYLGKFEIRENIEAGSIITIGHTDPTFTVRGYEQKSHVVLNHSANDMARINVAGAGVNGGTILSISNPASLGDADIEFIVPTSVDSGGSRVELTGDQTGTFHYLNHWQVADDSRGILYHQRWQGSRVAVLGDITLGANARLDLTRNWNNTFSFAGNITLGPGAQLHPVAGQTLELAAGKTLAGSGAIHAPVTTGAGTILAPGSSPGTLSIEGNLTLGAANTYQWEIDADGNADLIAVNGDLVIPDDFTIELIPIAKGSSGDFDLFTYTGLFSGDPANWTVVDNGMPYTEIVDTGNAIRITGLVQIPEPASALLLLAALGLLPSRQWTRRIRNRRG